MSMAESTLEKSTLRVSGMTCASCAVSLEKHLHAQPGVAEVLVNYPNKSVFVRYDSSVQSVSKLGEAARAIGYEIISGDQQTQQHSLDALEAQSRRSLRLKLWVAAAFSLPVLIISMFFMGKIPGENWLLLVLSLPVMLWSGSEFFVNAAKRLRRGGMSMDTLVALSTGVAFGFSVLATAWPQLFTDRGFPAHVYFESAVIIITLILLGRFLESRAKGRAAAAIRALLALQPREVAVIRNGEEQVLPLGKVMAGDLVLLKPGEKVPVDGKIKRGETHIDESMLTGESLPVAKQRGDQVFAGTINQHGSVRIFATAVGMETVLSHLIQMVQEAQGSKPHIQKLVDQIAAIFVPVVIGIAVLAASIWWIWGPEPRFSYGLVALITVLIIACPCALGLATPTALMVGIGKGAQAGILVQDAQALELAYQAEVLVLDKTGTITEGRPVVTEVVWAAQTAVDAMEQLLVAVENQSEHPVAEAIVRHYAADDREVWKVGGFTSLPGKGVLIDWEGKVFAVGNVGLMTELEARLGKDLLAAEERLLSRGETLAYVALDKRVVGLVAVADQVRPGAKAAISGLQARGLRVVMLTGDNAATAAAVGDATGITEWKAACLPEDKLRYIRNLQAQGYTVIMAGDGVNDAAALAQADVGMAMGSGTDIAMQSAGITLMHAKLAQIVGAIDLSRATIRTIRQNLFWAFIYNLVAIPVAGGVLWPAFGFLLSPMIGGAAMALSSISVVLNSLRLKFK